MLKSRIKTCLVIAAGLGILALALPVIHPDVLMAQPPPLNVNILSPLPLPTRSVDNPAQQPFQLRLTGFSLADGFRGNSKCFTVPSGKRLVLEFVSAALILPAGQNPSVTLFLPIEAECDNDEISLAHRLLTALEEPNAQAGHDLHVTSQLVRLYAEPGATVGVTMSRAEFDGTASGSVSLTGYLVDVP